MRISLPFGVILSATAVMACQNFPAGFVPFSTVPTVTGANKAGDRLVVGALKGNNFSVISANLPLPRALNEEYCDASVFLAPTSSYLNVYVPSAAERSGDFSAFAGILIDPTTNQPFPAGIIPASRLGGIYAFRIGSQSIPPVQCASSSPGPRSLRVDGNAELLSDFVITCTGGFPISSNQSVPTVNVSVSINGTITSRQLAAPNWSEALLLVDDHPTASQVVCSTSNGLCPITGTGTTGGSPQDPNIFQGQQTQSSGLTFTGIPFNPPGPSGSRSFRITNVKVDAQALGSGSALSPTNISMSVTLSSPATPLTVAPQVVGIVQNAFTVTSKAPQSGSSGLTQFTLTYAEGFASAFKVRSGTVFLNPDLSPSPTNQDSPGQLLPGSETGFYSGFFPFLSRGNLGIAGLADNGTRLYAQLSNVPSGVTVSTNAVINMFAGTTSSGTIRLINATPSTAGSFSPQGTSTAPVTLTRDASGTVTAVFEVLRNDPLSLESVDIPFFFSFSSGASLPSVNMIAGLAPVASNTVTPLPRFTSATPITVTAANPSAPLQVSPQKLQFTAISGGNTPGLQNVGVTASGSPQGFTTQVIPANASWLTVTPTSGVTPATLNVSATPGNLPVGTQNAVLRIVPRDTSQSPVDIAVSLVITTASPKLGVAPQTLVFAATQGSSKLQEQSLLVRNLGGGRVTFTASVVGKSSWIKDVTPSSGVAGPDLPAILRVHVNAQGLQAGTYSDIIRFVAAGVNTDIPVTLTVRSPGAVLKLSSTGVKFEVRQGNGTSAQSDVRVLNVGDPGTTVSFSATLLTGSDWAILSVSKNQATVTLPGLLTLKVNPNVSTFPAGARTALVQVTDNGSQNSPQFLTAVLQVDALATAAPPDPSPAGVFLLATAGKPQPSAPVVLNYSSTIPTPYQNTAVTTDGANWLSVSPASGLVSTSSPANLTLAASTGSLKAGIYSGIVSIFIGTSLRTVHVTLVVLPGASGASEPGIRSAAGCLPQQLIVVQSELADNFSQLVGFPSLLQVQVKDDCGDPVVDASVVATFDNGDGPLRLDGDNTGFYSASWTPGHVFPGMSIIFDATNPTLLSPSTPTGQTSKVAEAVNILAAGARLSGNVLANPNPLPVLSVGGTVNNSNPVASDPLAPGTIASVYGNQMATGTQLAPGPPLPTQFLGTSIRIGNFRAPLFYVSPTQVNVQIPFELAPNQSYPVVAEVNGLSSVPDTIFVAPATPAVITFPDGSAKAQHADTTYATTATPAKPGESLAIYLVGMGVTTPAVASAEGAPFNPHPLTNFPPTMTIDGAPVVLQFPGGLVGGSVGLYQINFVVPAGARTGALDMIVTQNGFPAKVTVNGVVSFPKLIVGR